MNAQPQPFFFSAERNNLTILKPKQNLNKIFYLIVLLLLILLTTIDFKI